MWDVHFIATVGQVGSLESKMYFQQHIDIAKHTGGSFFLWERVYLYFMKRLLIAITDLCATTAPCLFALNTAFLRIQLPPARLPRISQTSTGSTEPAVHVAGGCDLSADFHLNPPPWSPPRRVRHGLRGNRPRTFSEYSPAPNSPGSHMRAASEPVKISSVLGGEG